MAAVAKWARDRATARLNYDEAALLMGFSRRWLMRLLQDDHWRTIYLWFPRPIGGKSRRFFERRVVLSWVRDRNKTFKKPVNKTN